MPPRRGGKSLVTNSTRVIVSSLPADDAIGHPPAPLGQHLIEVLVQCLADGGGRVGMPGTAGAHIKHAPMMMLLLLGIIGLNIYMFVIIPKGFFPRQDLGQLNGGMRADQSISFQAMQGSCSSSWTSSAPIRAVATVVGFTGGNSPRRRQLHVRDAEAAVGAQGRYPDDHPAPAAEAPERHRRRALPQPGAGRADWRAPVQLHLSVHSPERRSREPAPLGHPPRRADEAGPRTDRHRHGPAGSRHRVVPHRRPRDRFPLRHQLARHRQRACTTRSASGRSPRSTPASISITSSWKSRRATRNLRRR